MVGGVLQFLVQVPSLRALGFRFVPRLDLSDPGLRRVAWLMLPATFGLAATQINILVDTALASWCQDGAITWLSLAFRLMQLPIGLFGVAIASANLARVSKDAARGDVAALRSNLAAALRTAALLTLPATAGLIALRVPIVRVLFEHGGVFTRASTLNTASAVLCYAVGLFAYSVTKVQVPTFYALGDTRWPVASSAVAVGLKILVNLALLVLLPREQLFMGLALTTSLAAWANLALLSIGLRRKAGSMRGLGVLPTAGRLALLSVVVGVASSATQAGLEHLGGAPGVWREIFRLLVSILAGTMVAGGGALALGVPEAEILFRRITGFDRRRSRR
jgi:putative peptidoglycan lipid II flippase